MLEKIALKYYSQGYNCAESIVLAGNEAYQLGLDETAIHAFGSFGGGLQCGDVCGCLTGGAAIISAMFVKTKAHDSEVIKPYTVLFVQEFEKVVGARRCDEVKPLLHTPERRCGKTVELGAIALENAIQKMNQQN